MNERIMALESAVRGDAPIGEIGEWARALLAAGQGQRGWDPTPWTSKWRAAFAAAGVPFAPNGDRPEITIDSSSTTELRSNNGGLIVPSVERFADLTSLPLKPLRHTIYQLYQVRLQIGVGVHLWLWSNQAVVINATTDQRDGFLHGPRPGMRLTVSLAPGAAQELTW